MRPGQQKAIGLGLYAFMNSRRQIAYFMRSIRLLGNRQPFWLGVIRREAAEKYVAECWMMTTRRKIGLGAPEPTSLAFTFDEAVDQWLVALEAAERDPQTLYSYRRDLARAKAVLGSKPLPLITLQDVEALRVHLHSLGLSYRSRKNTEHVASMLFRFACNPSRAWADKNPFDGLIAEKAQKGSARRRDEKFRGLHPREDARLLAACDSSWRRCALAIGLYLGVRETAVATLHVQDIDLFSGTICVLSEFNKGRSVGVREDQWLPIPRHLYPHLREWYDKAVALNTGWLFPTGLTKGKKSASGHLFPKKLREITIRSAKALGYTHATYHAFRSICNNRLRASGIERTLREVAAGARGVLGHASEASAQPYIRPQIEHLKPIIDAYDDWLDIQSKTPSRVVDFGSKR